MTALVITALPPAEAGRRQQLNRLVSALGGRGDAVWLLFYGDGVFNLLDGSRAAEELLGLPADFYAVAEDVADRGAAARLAPPVRTVGYEGVVDLVLRADRTVTGI